MKETELKVFIDAVSRHFAQTTSSSIEIQTPFLSTDPLSLLSDYSARIKIMGTYTGDVIFTASHRMLITMLSRYGHRKTDRSHLLDLVGEIANAIAANARGPFGEGFSISTPDVARGAAMQLFHRPGHKSVCIPLQWEDQRALLIVATSMLKDKRARPASRAAPAPNVDSLAISKGSIEPVALKPPQ